MLDRKPEAWTQKDEVFHIKTTGTWSERWAKLSAINPPELRKVELLWWKITCLAGYLYASRKPRERAKQFPGYDHEELVRIAKLELKHAEAGYQLAYQVLLDTQPDGAVVG